MTSQKAVPMFAVLTIALLMAGESSGQQDRKNGRLPGGNWTVVFEPYTGSGHELMPVSVVSLRGETYPASGTMAIKDLVLKNRSDKTVESVEFTFRVYEAQKPDDLLTTRRWVRTHLGSNKLAAGAEFRLPNAASMGAGFANHRRAVFSPLLKQGNLEGDFHIVLTITKVYFDDGSVWVFQEPAQ